MSGDTYFHVFPSILRPLHPSNLRPFPSPPPTSFLNDAKSFRVCVSVHFPLSFYSFCNFIILCFHLFCLLIVALMFIPIVTRSHRCLSFISHIDSVAP